MVIVIQGKMKWREGPKSGSGVGSDWPSGREDFTEKVQAVSILGAKYPWW